MQPMPLPLNRRIGRDIDALRVFKAGIGKMAGALPLVVDKPLPRSGAIIREFPLHRGQEIGRIIRPKNLNNICFEIRQEDFFRVRKPATPANPKLEFQKLFKAAREGRKEAKQHIGYGHPAQRGFFAGRGCKGRMPLHPIDVVPPKLDAWWWAPAGLAARISTAEQANIAAERARFEIERKARYKRQEMIEEGERIEAELSVQSFVAELTKPGADICKLFAQFAELTKSIKGQHQYYANRELTTQLRATKFRSIGHGHFSRAFIGPDGFVYKVNFNNSSTDSWFGYAVNCMLDPNPHTPRIYQIESKGKSFCAKMELLTPPPSDFWDAHISGHKFTGFADDSLESVMDAFRCREFDAIRLMQLVQQTKEETNGRYDIHNENIMLRVHGDSYTVVLTDPLAYGTFNMRTFERKLEA